MTTTITTEIGIAITTTVKTTTMATITTTTGDRSLRQRFASSYGCFALAVVSFASNLQAANACTEVCVSAVTKPVDAVKRGYAVFVGESIDPEPSSASHVARVRVILAYSDELENEVKVAAGSAADCHPYLEPGRRFLFVAPAKPADSVFETNDCLFPVTRIEDARREIEALDKWWRKHHDGHDHAKVTNVEAPVEPACLSADSETRPALLVRVVDQTGAVLEGATVTARGKSARTSGKTHLGEVLLSLGEPGQYDVLAEYSGFLPCRMRHLWVRTGCMTEITLRLTLGRGEICFF